WSGLSLARPCERRVGRRVRLHGTLMEVADLGHAMLVDQHADRAGKFFITRRRARALELTQLHDDARLEMIATRRKGCELRCRCHGYSPSVAPRTGDVDGVVIRLAGTMVRILLQPVPAHPAEESGARPARFEQALLIALGHDAVEL